MSRGRGVSVSEDGRANRRLILPELVPIRRINADGRSDSQTGGRQQVWRNRADTESAIS